MSVHVNLSRSFSSVFPGPICAFFSPVHVVVQKPTSDQKVGNRQGSVRVCYLTFHLQNLAPAVLQPLILFLFLPKTSLPGGLLEYR